MSVLLTGGAGFIGSQVARHLLERGDEVVALDNFDPYYDPQIKRRNVEELLGRKAFTLREGDIRDRPLLEELFTRHKFKAVIHLAARAGVRASVENPLLTAQVNVEGTVALLEAARRRNVRRFVFASSSSVYGERSAIPFREDDRIDRPESPYAATKAAGEALVWTYHHLFGLDTACLRFFTVYGPRQRPEMAIHYFTRLIETGQEVPMYGDGSARRDFTYVDDIVDGIARALDRAKGFEIYNLGNSAAVKLIDLIAEIGKTLGKTPKIKPQPVQAGDVSTTWASIDRAKERLDWKPTTPLGPGLQKFVAWYRGEGRGPRK